MNWPLALGVLIAFGAGWLVLRPALSAMLAGMPARRRGLIVAGLFVLAAVFFFAIRLAPFGIVALVLGGGAAMRGFTGDALREGLSDDGPAGPSFGSGMSEPEALSVLGLKPGADAAAIDAAHKRMIVLAHPDRGGSDYLAAKVNEARAVLKR